MRRGTAFLSLAVLGTVVWAAKDIGEGRSTYELPGVSPVVADALVLGAEYANLKHPGCDLDPSLLAGISYVESHHGTIAGSSVGADGVVDPPVRGIPLDGRPGIILLLDTDDGVLDGDKVYDRAVGPLQFLPGTWLHYRPSPDANPQRYRDAAQAAGSLLCSVAAAEGRPISEPDVEEAAIRSYNNSADYVREVRAKRDEYRSSARGGGRGSRPVTFDDVSSKLAVEGRAKTDALERILDDAPGDMLDRGYGYVEPFVNVVWNTLDRNDTPDPGKASASSAASSIVEAAEAWVGRDYRPGVGEQCAFFVRQVLADAGVVLTPEVTRQTLDQWSSPGPGVANSFGGDQGLVIERVEDLQPGDIVMMENTYGPWERGSITHVGIVVEVNGPSADDVIIVDRPTASAPVQRRPLSTFEFFGGGVRV